MNNELTVHFEAAPGNPGRGNVLRFSRFEVVFEAYQSNPVLRISQAFSEFKIVCGDDPVYLGRATIKGLVNTGFVWICEVTLDEGWLDFDPGPSLLSVATVQGAFDAFMNTWQKQYRVLPEYKTVVADMQTYLMDLRSWLEQVEWSIRSSPSQNRGTLEREVAYSLGEKVIPVVDELFGKFEVVSEAIPPDQLPAHRSYMKRQLHPLVLCSPFAWRTFMKPLGYAGDYEMINMIAFEPLDGSSLYAKVMNLWFLRQPPAQAHRNRLSSLTDLLVQEIARALSRRKPARIFNLGCGPAVEIQRFLRDSQLSDDVHFTLVDFNEETLSHAQSVLERLRAEHARRTSFRLVRESVTQILKEGGKTVERTPERQYDLVYCAGLLDYLPDHICQRLLAVLYGRVNPGGLLLATNVTTCNPLRSGMEHLLDWHLLYRDTPQARKLVPPGVAADDVSINTEPTGINLFINVRKPPHGS